MSLSELAGATVVYVFPRASSPLQPAIDGWAEIPGASGCTPQSLAYAAHFSDLKRAGVEHVFGISAQSPVDQKEVVTRLDLPFALLSDEDLELSRILLLPTFSVNEMTLYSRLTLICVDGRIERVFYPVDKPEDDVVEVIDYLKRRTANA